MVKTEGRKSRDTLPLIPPFLHIFLYKTASATRNQINSAFRTAATTFAFSSIWILLLCLTLFCRCPQRSWIWTRSTTSPSLSSQNLNYKRFNKLPTKLSNKLINNLNNISILSTIYFLLLGTNCPFVFWANVHHLLKDVTWTTQEQCPRSPAYRSLRLLWHAVSVVRHCADTTTTTN